MVIFNFNKYRKLFHYPITQWPMLAMILVLTGVQSMLVSIQPWPLKVLVDYALGDIAVPGFFKTLFHALPWHLDSVALVFLAGVAGLVLFALNSLLDASLTLSWASAGQRMVYQLAADLFSRFQGLSILYHRRCKVGDALSRLTEDSYCVFALTANMVILPWQKLFTLATIGVIAWNMNPTLTMISLVVAPVMAGSSFYFAPRLKKQARLDRETQSRLMSFVHQTITAILLVQAFGTESRNRQHFEEIADDATSLSQRKELIKSLYGLVNGLITAMGTAIVLFTGGHKVLTGSLSVGSLLVFLVYLRTIQGAINGLLGIYGDLKINEARADRVVEVFASPDDVREIPNTKPLPAIGAGQGRHVVFKNITFGYETGRPVLKDVTFEACPGETIAIVGPTGSGKSTLASLALRYFDPWQGQVTVDGIDARTVTLASLRSQVSIVLQEPFLLPLSVAENIAYGRAGASQAEILAAAKAAHADGFIQRLPNGYDTLIGEHGATLSGGEKQRLAIARAFIKNAPVLILDEPTSALDSHAEAALQQALQRLTAGKTTLIIAHRLSTIRDADRIVVLADGRIVETGTHQELLQNHGVYKHLYRLQFPSSMDRITAP